MADENSPLPDGGDEPTVPDLGGFAVAIASQWNYLLGAGVAGLVFWHAYTHPSAAISMVAWELAFAVVALVVFGLALRGAWRSAADVST